MNTSTTHSSDNTDKAAVAARRIHQGEKGEVEFLSILQEALTQPGIVNAAYRAFWNYSIGNQILAAMQLTARGLALSPIASFNAWKDKGRSVKKGQKAISLFMPVSVRRKEKNEASSVEAEAEAGEGGAFNIFRLRANWFSLDQTEGAEFVPEVVAPTWDAATALAALGITEEPFQSLQGNVLGYATTHRSIAISPLNPLKHKTRFHEMAHIVLGHTDETGMTDTPTTPRDLREAEAEGVAYILCALLDLPGQAESRNYIQSWLDGRELPEKSARKVFGAADRIVKAGQPLGH